MGYPLSDLHWAPDQGDNDRTARLAAKLERPREHGLTLAEWTELLLSLTPCWLPVSGLPKNRRMANFRANLAGYAEPPVARKAYLSISREARIKVMMLRAAEGTALYHPGDRIRNNDAWDAVAILAGHDRNGAPVPERLTSARCRTSPIQ